MSTANNKEKVRQYINYMNSGQIDEAFAMLAPDATWWIPTDQPGGKTFTKDDMLGSIGVFMGVFAKKPEFTIEQLTAEDDRVCVLQTARGGLSRGGASYANDYHMFYRFRDGLIVEVREYMNPICAAALMAEMGV